MCMYVYAHMYMCEHICMWMCVCVRACTCVSIYACECMYVCIRTHVQVWAHMHVSVYVCVHTCTCVNTHAREYVCVFLSVSWQVTVRRLSSLLLPRGSPGLSCQSSCQVPSLISLILNSGFQRIYVYPSHVLMGIHSITWWYDFLHVIKVCS